MIVATIEHPNGSHLHLDENGRWTGDDAFLVGVANSCRETPRYYPNRTAGRAEEVAAVIGGKVIFVIPLRNSAPPDAVY
jgi:hypothetical protein